MRYLTSKVGLDEILKRFDDTPFAVSPTGPVVSVAHAKQLTLRAWSTRTQATGPGPDIEPDEQAAEPEGVSAPIEVLVELLPAKTVRIATGLQLSLSDPQTLGLELLDEFQEVNPPEKPAGDETEQSRSLPDTRRFVARMSEAVSLKPGEITVPVNFDIPTVDADNMQHNIAGTFEVVVRTPRAQRTVAETATGVALIGGSLELRLGHLCDQKGCVEHFHKSLGEIPGLAAVLPHAGLKDSRATVYLRARQPVDVWSLRGKLRACGVEVVGVVPHGLISYRLRVELPRWRVDAQSSEVLQCLACRDRTAQVLEKLPWVEDVEVAGGGINSRTAKPDVDLVELLDALTASETAPLAVWLLPAGVPMPKAAPPRVADRNAGPRQGGSNVHPVVEFHFGHTCDVGTDVLAVLGKHAWPSRTHAESAGASMIARASLGDRKFANLTVVLDEFRSTGRVPRKIRLSEFGDIRIQLEFAHVCGEVEYSKPPKKETQQDPKHMHSEDDDRAEEKPSGPNTDSEQSRNEGAGKDSEADPTSASKSPGTPKSEGEQEPNQDNNKPKPKKPFVPKPLRPAKSSNGRQAIEAALARVEWVQQAMFHDYHTRPKFTGPRKLTLTLQAEGDDVVKVDELLVALRDAGCPPKSVIVSRRFPGIPFGKQVPGDLLVTDRQGKRIPLVSLQKPGQPLAVAFVSLKCTRHEKYVADPKLYQQLARTIDKYKDRVDIVAVSANAEDHFADVVEFWENTGLSVPLLHDADGQARSVFNSQVTPPPHLFVFDADARLRYAGDPHDSWEEPEKRKDDFLDRALELVLAGTYQANGAVFFNKSVCNCSDPNCKCPKCGCGATCRCAIKH